MEIVEYVEAEFRRIKQLGFVLSKRPNNKDGGIGNTFEDLLGVVENNLSAADYKGFEIKSQRESTDSFISLFSKSPSQPKKANSFLRETFGEIRDEVNMKKLYASIYGHRKSLVYNKYNMHLIVDSPNEVLRLVIEDLDNNILCDNVCWEYNALRKATKKLKNLLFVSAETQILDNQVSFHYRKGELFFGFDFDKFIAAICDGYVRFEPRIGVYKSGKNIGKTHDHGSGFRIHKDNFHKIFTTHRVIE